MGLFSGGTPIKELREKRFEKTSKMSLGGLKRSIASRMKKTDARGEIDRKHQSRVNKAIRNPK